MKIKQNYLLILVSIALSLSSCVKLEEDVSQLCGIFKNLKIKPVSTFEYDKKIELVADSFYAAEYTWTGPNNFSYTTTNKVTITYNSTFYHRGWYYLTISYKNCPKIYDSIYVDVKLSQGTPSCSPTNNNSTYTKISALTVQNKDYYSITVNKFIDYKIECASSAGDLTYRFNNYWNSKKLETGIYYTTSEDKMSDNESINKVYVHEIHTNTRWYAELNKPVYVSYVNGKLTITHCNLIFSGTIINGNTYTTSSSSKITLP